MFKIIFFYKKYKKERYLKGQAPCMPPNRINNAFLFNQPEEMIKGRYQCLHKYNF